jgi:predicted RecB family nuclease
MQRIGGHAIFSATDLNDYLECKRLAELEALVACGKLARPESIDAQRELIRRKGEEHERRHLQTLKSIHAGDVVEFSRPEHDLQAYRTAEARTLEAMQAGAKTIYQATFFDGQFIGHADFLRRVERPSKLGAWSYEVADTKLAHGSKAYFLVQLCNYSEHLARLQGRLPEYGAVVLGNGVEERFRLHDYMAYYRHLKAAFSAFAAEALDRDAAREYPFERKHCAVCRWDVQCAKRRRDDDHLSLVAWMRRDQIAKLEEAGITTVAQLAAAENAPSGMHPESFAKLRRQAALQVLGREQGPRYELLPPQPATGFALLPEPAPGDVFFDIEGDPFFSPERGLEYLFGFWIPDEEPPYRAFWAYDHAQEKARFAEVVEFIRDRRRRFPAMHVYHYAEYEKAALRRLAQIHCTHEDEVDELLRGEVFVDLYAVLRQSLALSEENYGLKNLERFYALTRATEVKRGDDSIVTFENWLLERDPHKLADIEAYNRDDCRSTFMARAWMLARRAEAIARFGDIPFRPVKAPQEPCHAAFEPHCGKCRRRQADEREEEKRSGLERALLEPVLPPAGEEEYNLMRPDRRMRYLLANLMAYHRREEKPQWWAYYDRCENVDGLIDLDREAIGGLRLRDDVPPERLKQSHVYTYEFPEQPHKMGPGDADDPRTRSRAGQILEVDDENGRLRLKSTRPLEEARAIGELIPPGPISTKAQRAAIARIAERYLAGVLERELPATFDLLAGRDPRLTALPRGTRLQPPRVDAQSVSAVVRALDASYLFIQGPPGSGKSTIGSQVICDLLAAGQRVGVMSPGHKANHHLLNKVEECMAARGGRFKGLYKHSDEDSKYASPLPRPCIESTDSNERFAAGGYDLAGGTAWLFAREELAGAFDYLFVDEAGQVSLADAIAVSACARSVVLLGDPSQLAQVSQGKHPPHAGISVLAHLLGGAQTVPPHRGIFLDVSYRMQPQICAFISETMYDGRLTPAPKTYGHAVRGAGAERAGLAYMPIAHAGNASSSVEEADAIVGEIALLRQGSVPESEIIVVTPYNAQRRLIARKLKDAGIGVRVGTVDKFQGQEADVVFYSMATSSGDDLPRGMDFLFEKNRFNVAISRARALSVLVCSPRLLDVACRTPEEMALVNLLCAFAERASVV